MEILIHVCSLHKPCLLWWHQLWGAPLDSGTPRFEHKFLAHPSFLCKGCYLHPMDPRMSCTMTPLLVQILGVCGHPVLGEHLGTQKALDQALEPLLAGFRQLCRPPSSAGTPARTPFQRTLPALEGRSNEGSSAGTPTSGTHPNFTTARTGGKNTLDLNSSVHHNVLVVQRPCLFNSARPSPICIVSTLSTWQKLRFDTHGFWRDHPRMEFFTCT